ncbi:peptidyl-prolyl cis-trans isomerase [Paraburkholderia phenoliruptrix]|uniref:peptidylprolyl isomerase n=1 Tax=Paraburkholderia phenoliruptrix TaxID=252970 RepID=A0ABV3WKT3_9BURK|nr:peptidyl-prolyl cis-trans isomerase [Paraburkholderia phenoliruptrix]MDR6393077.1 hypothetical protein [Paraburkholderia phenoliruptrix]
MKTSLVLSCIAVTAVVCGAAADVLAQTAATELLMGVVATVNGVPIVQNQLDAAVLASHQPDTLRLRELAKQQLIAQELFRQNAEKQHYDARPEVQEAIAAAKVNAETQIYLKDNVRPEPVTDAQIHARYDEIVASLGKEEYKSRVIAVADDATAATVIAQLKKGVSFDAVARQYSVAPTRSAGGELPWVSFKAPLTEGRTQGLPLGVAQAIMQLPVGGITPVPIVAADARLIVKLEAKRPTSVPTFGQAKDTIRAQLQTLALERAAAAFVADQLQAATIRQR